MGNPEPADDRDAKPPMEIRGGDRPADYIVGFDVASDGESAAVIGSPARGLIQWAQGGMLPPGTLRDASGEFAGYFEKDGCPGHEDDEPPGGNDPDTQ